MRYPIATQPLTHIYSLPFIQVSVVRLQTVLSQNAYMLFYSQDEMGSSVNGTKESTSAKANGAKPKGMANGIIKPTASLAVKRPRLDEEVGDRVDRSPVNRREKRAKVGELTAAESTAEMSKDERWRLRKERKKAKKLEKLNGPSKSTANDYDLAT